MNTFIDDKHLCSWAGLTPRCNESTKKKKSVRITKAGIYLKPLLVQCALNAIKDKSCPYIKARYESLMDRNFKSHKNIQNTPEEMISYLTNLGYNITLQNT